MSYNLDKQHEKGKYHAIERINELCDFYDRGGSRG